MSIHLRRREFLLGAAKLTLSLPTIQMLLQCENTFASISGDHPDSLVLMYTSNGYRSATFEPTSLNTFQDFSLIAPNVRSAPLSALTLNNGSLSPVISNSFNMNHIGVIRGIDWPGKDSSGGGNHEPAAVTTGSCNPAVFGSPSEPSIDQIINIHTQGNASLGVVTALACPTRQGSYPHWSYKKVGNEIIPIPSEGRPEVLYNQIVGNIVTNPALVQKVKDKRLSVANVINNQFTRLLSSGKKVLSRNDKGFLEQHLSLIQDQQKRINSMTTNACTVTGAPVLNQSSTNGGYTYNWEDDQVAPRLKVQIDNWILARMCGLSKTLVLHIGETDLTSGSTGEHHGISHSIPDAESNAQKLPLEKSYMEVFAYLVNRLDSVFDSDGKTLLQKTLCIFNNSAGTIHDYCRATHSAINLPIVVASRHPSIKATGYYLDYRTHSVPRYSIYENTPYDWGFKLGAQLNRFHVTIAEAMGLIPAQYLSTSTNTIGANINNDFDQYNLARSNEPLEGFL